MNRKINTKITELFGIERPILNGAMQWLATAELVSAFSNAGGLGVLSSATFPTPEAFHEELKRTKSMTDKPFAVNLTLMPSFAPPDYPKYLEACAQEGIKIIETSGRAPEQFIPFMKEHGMISVHKCTTVKHALKAQKIGCDAVIIDGFDAAGHVGESDIGTFSLCPRTVDSLDIPVICCGGIGDGRGLAAALMLGADGVTIGTRAFLTKEAPALENVKQSVADNVTEMDTILLLRRFKNTERVLNKGIAAKALELEKSGAPFDEIAPMASGRRLKIALQESGDLNDGVLTVGQCVGIIHDVPTVKEVMDKMMDDCFAMLDKYAR